MAQRQSQVIAIEKQVKARTNRDMSDLYATIQKPELFGGLSRTYRSLAEDGEKLPPEAKKVQKSVRDMTNAVQDALMELLNVTGTKDATNQKAKANVVVDGQTVIADAPVTFLLTLEKQLVDLHTFVGKLPVLDPAEQWSVNEATGLYATQPVETTRTKKVLRNHVRAAATEKHPAQVDTYSEDVIIGYYSLIKFSGAIPAPKREEILAKIEKLQKAVKAAREEANTITVTEFSPGRQIMDFIFG